MYEAAQIPKKNLTKILLPKFLPNLYEIEKI